MKNTFLLIKKYLWDNYSIGWIVVLLFIAIVLVFIVD